MKTFITAIAVVCLLGCQSYNPQLISGGVSIGTVSGLRFTIKSDAKRTEIANYICVGAAALRTITGAPDPAQLTAIIMRSIPANIKQQYPELIPYIVPVVVSAYQMAYDKYGANHDQLYAALNAIATGLEMGAAPYVTPGHAPTKPQYGLGITYKRWAG